MHKLWPDGHSVLAKFARTPPKVDSNSESDADIAYRSKTAKVELIKTVCFAKLCALVSLRTDRQSRDGQGGRARRR